MSVGKIIIVRLQERLICALLADNQILSVQAKRDSAVNVGDVYVGRVESISENIGAAFVDLGGCIAFLPLAEAKTALLTNRKADGRVKCGDELAVQVTKEPIKGKQPRVSGKIALSGQYAAVEAGSPRLQVSLKIPPRKRERFLTSEALKQAADRHVLIVRTNAKGLQDEAPLLAEAKELSARLSHILDTAAYRTCHSCLYRSKPSYVSFVENAYQAEYDEVVTDLPEVHDALREAFGESLPLRLYQDALLPLHKLYSLEARLKELLDKRVWLKSGGYLVIEQTEALVSIDVNTGKYEAGRDAEETYRKINREAAGMIAQHLRARNLSGIILADFINLKDKADEAELLEYMKSLLKKDPVPARAVDMTALGLMELTRKKIDKSLAEQMMA